MERNLYRGILENNIKDITKSLRHISIDKEVDIEVVDELIQSISSDDNCWNIPRVRRLMPLHLACICGRVSIAQILLEHGADTETTLEDGETALHFACLYGQVECVNLLILHNCNMDAQTRGDTGLMLTVACYGTKDRCVKDQYLSIAKSLIDAECNVNLTDSQGLAPLHLAAGKEDPEFLKLLIQAGADVNVRCFNMPKTPLFCAVSAEIEENVDLLLKAGCKVNDVLFPGVTALSTALGNGSVGIFLDLLKSGASPSIRPDTLEVQMYLVNKHYVFILALIAHGLDINWQNPYDKASILVTVSRQASSSMAKFLLQNGADSQLETRLGTTPLWAAVKCNNHSLLRIFLRWNCDLDIFSLEYNPLIPMSPLQLAIVNCNKTIAKQLLYFGCDLKPRWLKNEPIASRLNEREHFKKWLYDYFCKPVPLHHLCMLTVRRSIGPGLPRKIRSLTFPSKLKRYIITGEM